MCVLMSESCFFIPMIINTLFNLEASGKLKKKLLIAGPISRIFYLIGMAWRLGIGITWKKNNSNNNKVIWYATDIPQYHFRREEF